MKKILLIFCALATVAISQAQVTGISVETVIEHTEPYEDNDLTGMTTYRVYVEVTNETDFLTAMYGIPNEITMVTSSTGTFFQHDEGGFLASEVSPALISFLPSLEYDTWLTIGQEDSDDAGGTNLALNTPAGADDAFETGTEDLMITDGTWFTTNGQPNGVAGADLKILVAQFTSDGVVSGCLNAQVQIEGMTGSSNSDFAALPFSTDPDAVFGCLDEEATNYDPDATSTDCSCIYPCQLEVSETEVVQNTCPGGDNASIDLEATGAQGGVTYTLSGNSNSTGVFSGLTAGEYIIGAMDNEGCTDSITVNIVDPAPLEFDPVVTQISCFGETDGAITAATIGGTGDITYSIDDDTDISDTNNEYTDLVADTYTIYAQDECTTISQEITITEPTELTVTIDGSTDVSCFGAMDGSIDYTVEGGTPEYSVSETTDLDAGTYTVMVTDNAGCMATSEEVVITQPEEIVLDTEITAATCAGDTDGSVILSASGGAGGFTYSFDDGPYESQTEFTDLAPGPYPVSVMDANGCTTDGSVEVTEPDPLAFDNTVNGVSCAGDTDGSFIINVTGGNGGYEYYIAGDGPTTETEHENQVPGDIEIEVIDEEGCSAMTTITIGEPEELVISNADVTEDSGSGDGEIDITVEGGTEDYSFDWTGPDGFSADTEDISGLSAGEYTVEITDANGCTVTDTYNVLVGIDELFKNIEVTLMPNPSAGIFNLELAGLEGEKVTYRVVDLQGRTVLSESVEMTNGESREIIDLEGQANGLYYLMLQVGDEAGSIKLLKQD